MWVTVRRLFSTFAQGWPGAGLLILRLVAGSVALVFGLPGVRAAQSIETAALEGAAVIGGVLLLAGLWTPVSGCLIAAFAVLSLIVKSDDFWRNILLASIGVALAMIGPGAWSLDARLFGWRRIDVHGRER
jgi:putative oxidoreductase